MLISRVIFIPDLTDFDYQPVAQALKKELLVIILTKWRKRKEQAQFGMLTTGIGRQKIYLREAKNYTDVLNEILTKKLTGHKFKKDDIDFEFSKVNKLKGEAMVNIRKGKQILCYEYNCEIDWKAETEADDCDGNFKLSDINESDHDFEISNLTCKNEGEIGGKARGILKKCLRDELIKIFKPLNQEVMEMESDKQKLEEDSKKRKEAQELTSKVREETGELKEKLLQEQKEKDKELKEKFSKLS